MSYKNYHNFSDKQGLAGLFAIIILCLFILISIQPIRTNNESLIILEGEPANLTLVLDKEKRSFHGPVSSGMTLFDALYASAIAGDIKFKYALDEHNRTTILAVNNHLKSRFSFYINSQKIDIGEINTIKIKPGDQIEVRVE